MYDYARRLGLISSSDINGESLITIMKEQTRAYLAAIHALQLVDSRRQWFIYKSHINISVTTSSAIQDNIGINTVNRISVCVLCDFDIMLSSLSFNL